MCVCVIALYGGAVSFSPLTWQNRDHLLPPTRCWYFSTDGQKWLTTVSPESHILVITMRGFINDWLCKVVDKTILPFLGFWATCKKVHGVSDDCDWYNSSMDTLWSHRLDHLRCLEMLQILKRIWHLFGLGSVYFGSPVVPSFLNFPLYMLSLPSIVSLFMAVSISYLQLHVDQGPVGCN